MAHASGMWPPLLCCTGVAGGGFASPMVDASASETAAAAMRERDSPAGTKETAAAFAIRVATPLTERPKSPFSGLGKSPGGTPFTPDVRLHHRAVLVAAGDDATGALGGLVRQLSIDQFENESRRVSIGTPGDMSARRPTPVFDRTSPLAGIHKTVLAVLLRPREWRPTADR
jgi:protein phosphatase